MESQKICRLLIVIFLSLSLLFCFLYFQEVYKKAVISEDFVLEAVENLNSNGIRVSKDLFETIISEMNIYCYENEDSGRYDSKLAQVLISNVFGNDTVTTEFNTPSGTSIGIYGSLGDDYEIGRIIFSEDDMSFNLSRKGISISGGKNPLVNISDEISEDITTTIDSICASLISKSRFGYRISGTSNDEQYLIVTVIQTLDGYDIKESFINFIFEDKRIIVASGKWITSSPKAEYHNTLTDGINVLYNLNFDDVFEIHDERVVYSSKKSNNNRNFLLPTWEIEYTDKKGVLKKAYFDAV